MLHLRLFGPAELFDDNATVDASVLARPKRLALLAYLVAARPQGFHRRDTLLGMFWSELDQERGRAALRQALYTLRQSLPDGLIVTRGDGEVGIDYSLIDCDVIQFNRLRATNPDAALDVYRGDLLQGFFVSESPAFERWLEEERARLRHEAGGAAWEIAERVRADEPERAVAWARRAVALDPFNEDALRRLMRLFADANQHASALQVYQDFERFLERELETAPSQATQQLAESLRTPPKRNGSGNGNGNGNGGSATYAQTEPPHEGVAKRPRVRNFVIAAVLVLLATAGAFRLISAFDPAPVVAVGVIRTHGAHADTLGPVLRDMLATSLARVDGLTVLSNSAVVERMEDPKGGQSAAEAARHLGAERLLEGVLQPTLTGNYRLSLQWVELSNGHIQPAASIEEKHPFELVDAATTELARGLGKDAPSLRFASVSTNSFTAYRLYEEGLRQFYRGERNTARRFLADAVREDSMFAMAQWYYSRSLDYPLNVETSARAMRLAERASDRERLIIRASWLAEMDDPRTAAVAETLSIRYPAEPDGPLLLGRALLYSGDFLAAIPHLRRVVSMDSASLQSTSTRCRACDAMSEIATALGYADSAAALLRFTTTWTRAYPQSTPAWSAHTFALFMNGRTQDALRARERTIALPPFNYGDQFHSEIHIRAGNFEAADRILLERMQSSDRDLRSDGYWIYALSLRNQRRYSDALRVARLLRQANAKEPGNNPIYAAIAEAQVLLESGQPARAAALFDSIGNARFTNTSAARNARAYIGAYTRAAEAHFLAGDTVAVKRHLTDMEKWSAQTSFAFARKQHHFIRGLLYLARRDTTQAIGELRRAIVSPTHGTLRINYHLANALIETGRPREAVPYLNAALRGTVGGGGYSTPHRDLHEQAARAWRAAGVPDSALVHEAWLDRLRTYRAQPLVVEIADGFVDE